MKRTCRAFTKVCIWMVVIVTAVPAPLMAQTLPGSGLPGSGFPSLGAAGGVGPSAKDILSGSPVITNPTALQPLAPPPTPCPPLPAKTPPAIAPTGPTLNDFWPADSSAVLPPSADTRIRLERDEGFKKEHRDDILKQKQERDDRSTIDVDVRAKQEREERARLAQQTA